MGISQRTNLINVATSLFTHHEKNYLNCQNLYIRTNNLCCNVLLRARFCFSHVYQQNKFEWFQLITCKEHTLWRSTNLFKRNYPTLPNTEQFLYQTEKSSHRRCSKNKAVLKSFAIFTGKHLCWSFFFNFIKKRLQHRHFTIAKLLKVAILKNIYVRLLLN